jgi:CheY-like chemotaxis protein
LPTGATKPPRRAFVIIVPSAPHPSPEEDAKPTVLVVDDVILVRLLVADYLRESGFRVAEAGSTEEAMRIIGAQIPVDIVFADVNMPGSADGFELARWVRQNHAHIKVVLGSGVAGTAERAASLHYDGPIVAKPYDRHELERRLRAVLSGTA